MIDEKTLAPPERATYELLKCSLSAAVPLWQEKLKLLPWPAIQKRAQIAADVIASHGDNILFRSKKKGETAAAFNSLAEGIAALSFAPGGIKIFGLHFEEKYDSHNHLPVE